MFLDVFCVKGYNYKRILDLIVQSLDHLGKDHA